MEFHFNTNRAEAERWLSTAVKLLTTRDLHGTKSFAIRARESDPRLEATEQIIAVADTLLAGDMRINNYHQPDWYAILQLAQYTQNLELVATQYRRLALLLNPHRNRFPYADQAFRLVSEAWNVLSNASKKALYDNELSMYSRFDSAPSGSTQLFERQFLQMHHVQQQQPPQPQHFQSQQLPQHFYQPPPPPQEVQRPPPQQQFHLQQPHQQQKQQNLQPLLQQHQQPQQQFLRPPQQEEQQPQFLRPLQPEEPQRQQPQPQFLRPPQQEEEQTQPQFLRPHQQKEQQRQQQPQQQFLRPPPQLEKQQQQQYLPPPQQEGQQQQQAQQLLPPPEAEEEQQHHQKKQPVRKVPKRKDGRSATEVERPTENNVTESTSPPAESSRPAESATPTESAPPSVSTKLVSVSESSGNFWTACPYCYYLYEYPKVYEDCMLRCQNCKRGFSAVVIESPPVIGSGNVVNFCCWGYFPLGFEEKGKDTEGSAGWTPFSTMLACPIQGKKNVGRVKSANSGPRVYYDDEEALIDISDPSEDSDDEEWQKTERNKRAVKAKAKAPGPKSRAKTPVRASSRINKVNQNGRVHEKVGSGASLGGESVPKVSKAEPSKKAGTSRKRGAAELGKLDLNVEFSNNEGEEHAAQTVSQRNATANGTEDNIEGIGFFEGLDEFLSSLPILNVVADDKVKAN